MSPAERVDRPSRSVLPLRLLRAEIGLLFRRRRNQVLLAVLAAVPVLIGVAVRTRHRGPGDGSILGSITDNGLFAALAAFLVSTPLFLPLVVSVVAGDSIAGEAGTGTLRYLLTVPVGRTRLLGVKFGAVLVWNTACVLVVAVVGVLVGLLLFPSGDVTTLSGTRVSYASGLGRLVGVVGYLAVAMAVVGALGLFVSTMTEVPLAAMAATLTLTIVSEVLDAVPQLSWLHGWLPSHYWLQWVDLMRDPVRTDALWTGVGVGAGYVAFFTAAAWARFSGRDVTS